MMFTCQNAKAGDAGQSYGQTLLAAGGVRSDLPRFLELWERVLPYVPIKFKMLSVMSQTMGIART